MCQVIYFFVYTAPPFLFFYMYLFSKTQKKFRFLSVLIFMTPFVCQVMCQIIYFFVHTEPLFFIFICIYSLKIQKKFRFTWNFIFCYSLLKFHKTENVCDYRYSPTISKYISSIFFRYIFDIFFWHTL